MSHSQQNYSNTITSKDVIRAGKVTAVVGAVVNSVLAATKVIGGTMLGSAVLIADGMHSLSDLLGDFIAYFAVSFGHTDADESHPYGHGKFETVGTLTLSLLLGLVVLGIGWDASERLLTGATPTLPPIALAIAALSIVANELLYQYTFRVGTKVHSKLIIANAWHHRADGLSSAVALAGIGVNMLGYPMFDAIAALAISLLLAKMAWSMGKEAFDELTEKTVTPEVLSKAEKVIKATEGVRNLHLLRGRYMAGRIYVDVHVEVNPYISVSEGHLIAENVEHNLKRDIKNLVDAVVHIDPGSDIGIDETCYIVPEREALEAQVNEVLAKVWPHATIRKTVLHILPMQIEADIILNWPQATPLPLQAEQDAVRNQLTKPHGPLDNILFNIRL